MKFRYFCSTHTYTTHTGTGTGGTTCVSGFISFTYYYFLSAFSHSLQTIFLMEIYFVYFSFSSTLSSSFFVPPIYLSITLYSFIHFTEKNKNKIYYKALISSSSFACNNIRVLFTINDVNETCDFSILKTRIIIFINHVINIQIETYYYQQSNY